MSGRRFKVGDLAIVVLADDPLLLGTVAEVVGVLPESPVLACRIDGTLDSVLLDYEIDSDACRQLLTNLGAPATAHIMVRDAALMPLKGDEDELREEQSLDELERAPSLMFRGQRVVFDAENALVPARFPWKPYPVGEQLARAFRGRFTLR